MPPRRSTKRQHEEDERPNKRSGKGKKEPTYDTYDEALDGGVEMEEKGERYRDGEKAQRFYERALELYDKAFKFSQTYDAAYNQARVHFTLATSFQLPPLSLDTLRKSITLYRKATELSNSPLLLLDAGYNLGQAYISLADLLEDTNYVSEKEVAIEIRGFREEASRVLGDVLDGQEAFLRRVTEEGEGNADIQDQVIDEIEGGAEMVQQVEREKDVEMDVDEQNDDEDTGENDKEEESFETYLPTPSTFIDTALLLIDLHLSIWESTDPPTPPSEISQAIVRAILDRSAHFVPIGRQAELDLAEIKVLLSVDRIVWDIYRNQVQPGTGIEKSLEGAIMVLNHLLGSLDTQPPDEPTLRAEILTILADTHNSLANRLVWLLSSHSGNGNGTGPSPVAQQAWYNYSQAITYLGKALDLPTSPQTPREFKSSVLLSLSKASLERAKLAIGGLNDTAKRNAVQLMENAVNYGTRALEGLNWKGFEIMPKAINGGMNVPHQNGWDSEFLIRDSQLTLLRICYFGSKTDILPEDRRIHYVKGGHRLIELLRKVQSPRRIKFIEVRSWLEDLEDDSKVGEQEKDWWRSIEEALN